LPVSIHHIAPVHQGTRATFIPRSAVEARRKTPSVNITLLKHPTDRWLSPYEPEVTRSKRVGGISHHIAPVHQGTRAKHNWIGVTGNTWVICVPSYKINACIQYTKHYIAWVHKGTRAFSTCSSAAEHYIVCL